MILWIAHQFIFSLTWILQKSPSSKNKVKKLCLKEFNMDNYGDVHSIIKFLKTVVFTYAIFENWLRVSHLDSSIWYYSIWRHFQIWWKIWNFVSLRSGRLFSNKSTCMIWSKYKIWKIGYIFLSQKLINRKSNCFEM